MVFKLLQFQAGAIIPDHDSHPFISLLRINPHMVSGLHALSVDQIRVPLLKPLGCAVKKILNAPDQW